MINDSYIYTVAVIHKRFKPRTHFFKYNVLSLYLDFDEINEINKKIYFFSHNKFNLMSFHDIDHGPRDGSSLVDWVKKNLKSIGIIDKELKIKILCYPRIFGYVFNTLSIFFIFNKNCDLISLLYEVKNTMGE